VRRAIVVFSLLALAAGGAVVVAQSREAAVVLVPSRPNILVIVTDDQRADQLGPMPATSSWFGGGGTHYPDAFAQDPLCCPSRASLLTGLDAHNHGVGDNTIESVAGLDHRDSVAVALRRAGYRTGIAGKLFNGWRLGTAPPGFDRYAVMRAGYSNADFDVDGTVGPITGHSTEFVADRATALLDEWETADDAQPWFLYLAPFAPHWPYEPSPGDEAAPVDPFPRAEPIVRGDPTGVPNVVRARTPDPARAREVWTAQERTLLGVDRLVARVADKLARLGEDDTLAFFLSDNGYLLGESGVVEDKRMPYDAAVRIPFYVRWPGHLEPNAVDDRLVLQLDLVATIYHVTGLVPRTPVDGRSLLDTDRRDRIELEHLGDDAIPPWATIRGDRWQYVEWYDRDGAVAFRELYDLADDPLQLHNLLTGDRVDRRARDRADDMAKTLAADRQCAGRQGDTPCP
jgi:arylsulfatase A-like enzyme